MFHKPEDCENVSVPRDYIPKGAKLVEAYETATEIIIIGDTSGSITNALATTSRISLPFSVRLTWTERRSTSERS